MHLEVEFGAGKQVCIANIWGEAPPSIVGSQGEAAEPPNRADDLWVVLEGDRRTQAGT